MFILLSFPPSLTRCSSNSKSRKGNSSRSWTSGCSGVLKYELKRWLICPHRLFGWRKISLVTKPLRLSCAEIRRGPMQYMSSVRQMIVTVGCTISSPLGCTCYTSYCRGRLEPAHKLQEILQHSHANSAALSSGFLKCWGSLRNGSWFLFFL